MSDLDLVTETRNEVVAAMLLSGVSVAEIAEKLKVHPNTVYNLVKKEPFKEILRELSSKAFEDAQSIWKGAMQERIPQALKVLDHLLKTKSPKALEIILKTLGVDRGAVQQGISTGNIQILLPSLESKEKEVKNE